MCAIHVGRPVGSGFRVGDRVQTVKDYDGLWRKGDSAVVKSMGTPEAPMAVRFEHPRKTINSQPEHFRQWSPDHAVGGAEPELELAPGAPDSPAATLVRRNFDIFGHSHVFSSSMPPDVRSLLPMLSQV